MLVEGINTHTHACLTETKVFVHIAHNKRYKHVDGLTRTPSLRGAARLCGFFFHLYQTQTVPV